MGNNKADKLLISFLGALALAGLVYLLVTVTGYYKARGEIPRQEEELKKLQMAMKPYYRSLGLYQKAKPVLLEKPALLDNTLVVTEAARKTRFPHSGVFPLPSNIVGAKEYGIEHVRVAVETKEMLDDKAFWPFLIEVEKNDYGALRVEKLWLSRDARTAKPSDKWKIGQVIFGAYRKSMSSE